MGTFSSTPEQLDYDKQIVMRGAEIRLAMANIGAVCVSPSVTGLRESGLGIAPIGEYAHFSLYRRQVIRSGSQQLQLSTGVILAGYVSRVEGERIVVGGPSGNICAYDLWYRPFPGSQRYGKILDARKVTTFRLGLNLDKAAEQVALRTAEPGYIKLPTFWAAYEEGRVPDVADLPAVRHLCISAVQPGYKGPVLPCMRSPGGKISAIEPVEDDNLGILFNEGDVKREVVMVVPRFAVLRSQVRVGSEIAEGLSLGDFFPRRVYAGWGKLVELYGPRATDWFRNEVIQSRDIAIDGLTARNVDLCVSIAGARIYEDIRDLLGPDGFGSVQTVRARSAVTMPEVLRAERGRVSANFYNIQKGWMFKFGAFPERKNRHEQEEKDQMGSTLERDDRPGGDDREDSGGGE